MLRRYYGVMGEVSMPNMVMFMAGPERLEMPPSFNVIDMFDQRFKLPEDLRQCSCNMSDEDAAELLSHSDGLYLPQNWVVEPDEDGLKSRRLTWMHAYKMHAADRRQAWLDWWWSLPCLNQL
jgi:hypothetical protein